MHFNSGDLVHHDRLGDGVVRDFIDYEQGEPYCAVDFFAQDTTSVPEKELYYAL